MSKSGKSRYKQIGCCTRGGNASRPTEDRAIALAREHDSELLFFYVVDVSFAQGLTGKFDIDLVAHDLREIGKIVLEQAQLRAAEQGVTSRGEIREGPVADEIQGFVTRHKDMHMLVIGHMSDELRQHLQPVLERVEERQIEVVVVRPD